MSESQLDQMIQIAATWLLDSDHPVDGLGVHLAQTYPDAPILRLVLAIVSACDGVEQMISGNGVTGARIQQGWRIAAMLAAEAHMLEVVNHPRACAGDLLVWWDSQAGRG
jgi:hypothetical protein